MNRPPKPSPSSLSVSVTMSGCSSPVCWLTAGAELAASRAAHRAARLAAPGTEGPGAYTLSDVAKALCLQEADSWWAPSSRCLRAQ